MNRRQVEKRAHIFNGALTRSVYQFLHPVSGGSQVVDRGQFRGGFLDVCGVVADGATGNQVFARFGVHHKLLRLGAAHGAGVGLHRDKFETAASEDRPVRGIMLMVAGIQAGVIKVKGIAVLHQELPYPQQTCLGPGLVAKFGLNLVPDLGQLLVTPQLLAGDIRHHLFVGHAQGQPRAFTVLQLEQVLAHAGPAPTLFPQLTRMQRRQKELLTDAVHFLPDDALNLVDGALAQEEVRVDTRAYLTNVSGSQQKFVAGDLGIGRGFAQSGDEELGPTVHSGDTFWVYCLDVSANSKWFSDSAHGWRPETSASW